MTLKKTVLILIFAFTLNGCLNSTQKSDSSTLPKLLDTKELGPLIKNKNTIIVDARSSILFKKGHITSAINIPTESVFDKNYHPIKIKNIENIFSEMGVNFKSNIVIYDGGMLIKGGNLFWLFEYLGHEKVSLYIQGYKTWSKENNTEKSIQKLIKTNFYANIKPEYAVNSEYVMRTLDNPNVQLIDVRTHYDHKITDKIPGALRMPIHRLYSNYKKGIVLENKEKILETLSKLPKKKKYITYCDDGEHARMMYLFLRVAGYKVAHYVGSFAAWKNNQKLPVEKI